jgi:hypothetical protein
MLSKPCGRDGCPIVIERRAQHLLDRVTFCSMSCATQARYAAGWKPDRFLTPEARSKGARMGGKIAGRRRHRRTLIKAVRACERFLTEEYQEGLTAAQLQRIRVLMGRVYILGHFHGRQTTDSNRRYWQKKATAKRQREAA